MQKVKITDVSVPNETDILKCTQLQKFSTEMNNKNFLDCLKKSHKLLKSLESSLTKTSEYESQLLKCRREHASPPIENHSSEALARTTKDQSTTDIMNSPRNQIDLVNSWSTMSVVCLQYHYEELCKRYESLLYAYDQRCAASNVRDKALLRLRKRMSKAHRELVYVHQTLLCVGEKYLTLKHKKMSQRMHFQEKIEQLTDTMYEVLDIVERNRVELSEQLEQCASMEHDTAVALLLAEIKKCNTLLLENLHLKSKLEILSFE